MRESLQASDEWQHASASFRRMLDRPPLELDA
jgi:hypothetical protein